MAKPTKKFVYGTTPKGVAVFPWLTKPDTKFHSDGQYKTGLRLTEAEAAPFKAAILAEVAKVKAETEKFLKAKAASAESGKDKLKYRNALSDLKVHYPFVETVDDDGEPTGELEFKFSTSAVIKNADGSVRSKSIDIFDAKKQRIRPASIFAGSVLRIAYALSPYYIPGTNTVGVALYINAVQVIELVSAAGKGARADSFGFSEEEGYTADEEATDEAAEVVTEVAVESDEEDDSTNF
jgi:hypothetical protein